MATNTTDVLTTLIEASKALHARAMEAAQRVNKATDDYASRNDPYYPNELKNAFEALSMINALIDIVARRG